MALGGVPQHSCAPSYFLDTIVARSTVGWPSAVRRSGWGGGPVAAPGLLGLLVEYAKAGSSCRASSEEDIEASPSPLLELTHLP